MIYKITDNIRYVAGVGPQKAERFAKLGIKTVLDLLEFSPSDYIYPGITHIADLHGGTTATVSGVVTATHVWHGCFEVTIKDESGDCHIKWYNQAYLVNKIDKGMILTVWGRVSKHLGFDSPNYTTCTFRPEEVTGGTYGTHSTLIRPVIREILEHVEIPQYCLDGYADKETALKWLHFPLSPAGTSVALDRLKFDELLVQQVAMAVKRKQQAQQGAVAIEL